MAQDQKHPRSDWNKVYTTVPETTGWWSNLANFGSHLTEAGRIFAEAWGKYFFFPIAVIADIIGAILAWRQARIDNYNSDAIEKAWVETLTTLTATVALILFITGTTGVLTIAAWVVPLIFTIVVGVRAFYQLVLCLRSLVQFFREQSSESKQTFRHTALNSFVGFATFGLLAAGIGLVLVAKYEQLAWLGVVAGVLATAFAFYKGYSSYQTAKGSNRSHLYERLLREGEERRARATRSPQASQVVAQGFFSGAEAASVSSSRPQDEPAAREVLEG